MAEFTSRADIERLIGAHKVLELFNDSRSGVLSSDEVANLQEVISEANDFTSASLVSKGWTQSSLNELSEDRAVRRSATQIAASLAGERKPELANDEGEGPFHNLGVRGRAHLKMMASGELRSRKETQGAPKTNLRARISSSTPKTIFGRDTSDPDDNYGDGRGF